MAEVIKAPAAGKYVSITVQYPNSTLLLAPAKITMSAAIIGGQPPYIYNWVFDDGTTSSDPAPTKSYRTPGNYSVTLSVIDGQNAIICASTSLDIKSATGFNTGFAAYDSINNNLNDNILRLDLLRKYYETDTLQYADLVTFPFNHWIDTPGISDNLRSLAVLTGDSPVFVDFYENLLQWYSESPNVTDFLIQCEWFFVDVPAYTEIFLNCVSMFRDSPAYSELYTNCVSMFVDGLVLADSVAYTRILKIPQEMKYNISDLVFFAVRPFFEPYLKPADTVFLKPLIGSDKISDNRADAIVFSSFKYSVMIQSNDIIKIGGKTYADDIVRKNKTEAISITNTH